MHDVALAVLAVAGLLGVAAFLPPLAFRLNLPFTVLLAVVGCALGTGVLLLQGVQSPQMIGDMVTLFGGGGVSSSLFLAVFLPALLFEAAIAVDVRRLMDDFGHVLLLAIGAVLICSFAVGFALDAVSDAGLIACLLLGAIVATTDPAAVIGIFRDIGAPRRLSILVAGESLFNDAAAIVLFILLSGMLKGGQMPGVFSAIMQFVASFAGGLSFGYLAGRFACLVFPALRGWRLAEMTLTVSLAYVSFVLSDHYLHVSGVVAVVTAGLVLSAYGRTRMTPSTWDTLVETWEQIGFWANALIFLMAAMLVPKLLANMGWQHLWLLAVLFAATLAARAVVLFGLMPGLSHFGVADQVSPQFRLVVLWGGLRGAVSLALALAVTEDDALPAGAKSFVATMTTCFVLATLFINGTTLRLLISWLGLDKLSRADREVRHRALILALDAIREKVEAMGNEEEIEEPIIRQISGELERRGLDIAMLSEADTPLTAEDRVYIGLTTIAAHEHELCMAAFREQVISGHLADEAMAQVGRLMDGVKTDGRAGYETAAHASLSFPLWFRLSLWMQYRLGLHRWLAGQLSERFEHLLTTEARVRRVLRFTRTQVRPLLGQATAETLSQVLTARQTATQQALTALKLQFPDFARELQRRYLARVSWRLEEENYRAMLEESTISPEVYEDLARDLGRRRKALDQRLKLDVVLDRRSLLAQVPMFANLPPARLGQIAQLLRPRFVLPNERIVVAGDEGESMYFIATGAVEVKLATPVPLGSGAFFGEIALLTKRPRTADVVTMGYCRLLELHADEFESLMRTDPSLRATINDVAQKRLAELGLQPGPAPAE